MRDRQSRVFYGWWIVSIAALGLFFGDASIAVFSFGVFLKPLSAAFHAGRASILAAFRVLQFRETAQHKAYDASDGSGY